jgi:hypothetical protein
LALSSSASGMMPVAPAGVSTMAWRIAASAAYPLRRCSPSKGAINPILATGRTSVQPASSSASTIPIAAPRQPGVTPDG